METSLATVVFLRKGGKICLARKKKPIHHTSGEISYSLGTWNGYGGKQESDDVDIFHTAIRELCDESSVRANIEDLVPLGRVLFFWDGSVEDFPDMDVMFYVLDVWSGVPKESLEMGEPSWFSLDEIPYHEMMGGDKLLLPRMFSGEKVEGRLYFGSKKEDAPRFVTGL